MKLLHAELLASREFLPGQWLQAYHAPWLAVGAHAISALARTKEVHGLCHLPHSAVIR